MKLKNYLFIVAIFGATLAFVSCTPENIEDEQTEQQIDKGDVIIPQNG
ncbi:MAG: hypothetical protein HKN48_05340 [Flavobacteriaceae bacterium]|nr:hypothetical protein [Flavobacteriaceae bacterium]